MTTLDQKTMFAWKPAPFGRARKVPPFEAARWPLYERRPHNSPLRRDWTHDEVEKLYQLLDQGHGYTEIARRLKRTRTAIEVKTNRLRCKMTRRPTVLTAREVAALLGKGCAKSVTRWIEWGWLEAQASTHKGRRIWRVCWDDLMTFLHNESYWMSWDQTRINDADLRAEMMALRASRPRWLSVGEVAARYCVDIGTVKQWIYKDFLPAQRYGNAWIRESDLEGWVMPSERSKAGIPKRARRVVVGLDRIVAQ